MKELEITYNNIRLDILKCKDGEIEEEKVKQSIRDFEAKFKDDLYTEKLWDFYELIINRKTK